jgi:hypothetical protein
LLFSLHLSSNADCFFHLIILVLFSCVKCFNVLPSLRDKAQVEQLLRYIVEEVPEDSEKKRSFKYALYICFFTNALRLKLALLMGIVKVTSLLLQVSVYCL